MFTTAKVEANTGCQFTLLLLILIKIKLISHTFLQCDQALIVLIKPRKGNIKNINCQSKINPPLSLSLKVMEEFYHPKTVWVPLGILLGSGTLFAVLTLQWQCCFVTFSTATFGSAIITVTVDYFIELFALVHYIYERLRVGLPVCLSVADQTVTDRERWRDAISFV